MEEITKHYLISGRVQGVGFRAFTQRAAAEQKLRGWVRNLLDGRVEVLARGGRDPLTAFEIKLKAGPSHGHVESVAIRELAGGTDFANFTNFSVGKDGGKPWQEN